ncbi:acetoacetate--CoA ligase [Comamonas odontotermitis]|uniref:acetoacetate--CoA ligase n=1 Tax=Comamonas odontotermitis TaxID=379895 RepID=UPI0037538957
MTASIQALTHASTPQIRLYQNWLAQQHGLRFNSYEDLHQWSVSHLADFWRSIWDYYRLQSPVPLAQDLQVLSSDPMPGTQWFSGVQVSLPRQLLRHVQAADAAGLPAIVSDNERGEVREMSWPELQRQVASVAIALRKLGVQRGDRVAAYMPNIAETVVAMLACTSIGAVWSLCAPDMGVAAVVDRFKQIEPKVLIAVDGVYYGGKPLDRSATVQSLLAELPSVQQRIVISTPYATAPVPNSYDWQWATAQDAQAIATFEPEWLPFDHPIWIVYSSGTTGLPKPIVHGTGGILLALHVAGLHNDLGASYGDNNRNERFHWYSSTGWVMWNIQASGLLFGTTITIFDGHPAGSSSQPDWGVLWRFAAKHHTTIFGAGAAYYSNCMKAGLDIAAIPGLQQVRTLGSTGSPLAPEVQRWGSAQLQAAGAGEVFWCNISGGTDFCGAFIGGNRELPQAPGRMQCRWLGHAVEAWNEQGQPVLDEVGELVCVQPIPSMPLYFWNDPGKRRYLDSYFDHWPGIWRHGDWIQVDSDGSCIIYGRSDATINRQGLRMGTSEIYNAVEALPQVQDSMVVDLEYLGKDSYMPLFVVLREGIVLDDTVKASISQAIRTALSPRFVPDAILQVAEIPRTLTGKKLELPIKKLMLGQPAGKVLNPETMANPGCLAWYEAFAQRHLATLANA